MKIWRGGLFDPQLNLNCGAIRRAGPGAHCPTGQPARGPSRLKIKTASDTVDIQQLAGKIESGTNSAFHGFKINIHQTHPAAGDKLIAVQGFSAERSPGGQLLPGHPFLLFPAE